MMSQNRSQNSNRTQTQTPIHLHLHLPARCCATVNFRVVLDLPYHQLQRLKQCRMCLASFRQLGELQMGANPNCLTARLWCIFLLTSCAREQKIAFGLPREPLAENAWYCDRHSADGLHSLFHGSIPHCGRGRRCPFPDKRLVTLSSAAIVHMTDMNVGAHVYIGNGRFYRLLGFSDDPSELSLLVSAAKKSRTQPTARVSYRYHEVKIPLTPTMNGRHPTITAILTCLFAP